MMKKIIPILVIVLILISCSVNSIDKQIEIIRIGWIIENIDKKYWSSSTTNATLFYSLSIGYSGDYISSNDVE